MAITEQQAKRLKVGNFVKVIDASAVSGQKRFEVGRLYKLMNIGYDFRVMDLLCADGDYQGFYAWQLSINNEVPFYKKITLVGELKKNEASKANPKYFFYHKEKAIFGTNNLEAFKQINPVDITKRKGTFVKINSGAYAGLNKKIGKVYKVDELHSGGYLEIHMTKAEEKENPYADKVSYYLPKTVDFINNLANYEPVEKGQLVPCTVDGYAFGPINEDNFVFKPENSDISFKLPTSFLKDETKK